MNHGLFNLSGKVAIVTGAGRGLGEAMARGLAEAGADIVIADLDIANATRVAKGIEQQGRTALPLKVDVTAPGDLRKMVEAVVNQFGKIDILVNNAGIPRTGKVSEELAEESWQRVMDVNLNGVFFCSKYVGIQMIRQKFGRIINISSISGLIANKGRQVTDYCVSKGGIIMLTKSLASEWAQHNINVNAIAPGYFRTRMTEAAFSDPHISGEMFELTPLKRPGEVDELIGPVIFLASAASSFVTGHILIVDGGYTIW